MEFLYDKVYSNQYFALILFATIAVLLVLFIIVLLAAIRDAKKTKIAELNELEQEEIKEVKESAMEEQIPELNKEQNISENESYEFFANEDEQSKTMDIVLDNPVGENSMSSLLNEFEPEVPEVVEQPVESSNTSLDELLATVSQEDSSVVESDVNTIQDDNEVFFGDVDIAPAPVIPEPVDSVPFVAEEPILETTEMDFSQLLERNANEGLEEVVKPKEEVVTIDEDEDDFELPKAKDEEEKDIVLPKVELKNDEEDDFELPSAKVDDIKTSDIDLGATGILDFSSIESESYDINK